MSINVIMSQGILLEEAYMKGLKQITGEAFLPIIAGNLNFVVSKAMDLVIFCTYICTK